MSRPNLTLVKFCARCLDKLPNACHSDLCNECRFETRLTPAQKRERYQGFDNLLTQEPSKIARHGQDFTFSPGGHKPGFWARLWYDFQPTVWVIVALLLLGLIGGVW